MLRVRLRMRPRRMPLGEGRNPETGCGYGPAGRISRLRKLVTALIRHERIEGNYNYVHESQGYAEKVILDAMRHGEKHQPTMEMLDYWILEKDLIPKLFKVIIPRFANYQGCFTSVYKLQKQYPEKHHIDHAVIELKGNPWPPIVKHQETRGSLVNILLDEARKEFKLKKYQDLAAKFNDGNMHNLDTTTQSDVDKLSEQVELTNLSDDLGDEPSIDLTESTSDDTKPSSSGSST